MAKRALVLSGGGRKGAYQVGVLKRWLLEEGRNYDILCGISVGALNIAAMAQAPLGDPKAAYEKLAHIWDRVENAKIRKFWLFWYLAVLWRPSVYDSTPLQKWVKQELDLEAIQASGRELRVGAVSWETGNYKLVDQNNPKLADWVCASASFPVFLKPVLIDGEEWMDGGIREVTPLGDAIRLGADEIDVIMTSNPDRPSHWNATGANALKRAFRAIDLMSDEVMRGDIRECGLKNDLAERGAAYRIVKIRIQQPSRPLDENSLDFNPDLVKIERELGYSDSASASASASVSAR